jgi:hypothetical protein
MNIKEIEKRLKKASKWTPESCGEAEECSYIGETLICLTNRYEDCDNDWEFIAHSQQDIRALLDEVKRLKKIEKAAEKV